MYSSPAFAFDLQRFDPTTWTLTQTSSGYALTSGDTTITSSTLTNLFKDENVATGDTIELGGNLTNAAAVFEKNKDLTLDLKGYTWSYTNSNPLDVYNNLTLQDTSTNQTGTIKSSIKNTIWVNDGATLEVLSGNIEAKEKQAVYVGKNGKASIKGGKFVATTANAITVGYGSGGKIEISGGSFSKAPSSGLIVADMRNTTGYIDDYFCVGDSFAIKDSYIKLNVDGEEKYYSTQELADAAIAKIAYSITQNGETKYYTKDLYSARSGFSGNVTIGIATDTDSWGSDSFSSAFNVAQSGDTIQLANNITSTSSVDINNGKSLTLDLNGKTLTANAINVYSGLTINGETAGSKLDLENQFISQWATLSIVGGGVYTCSSKDLSKYVASGTNYAIVDDATLYVGTDYNTIAENSSAYTALNIDGVVSRYYTTADKANTYATTNVAYSLTYNGETKYYTTSENLQAAREAITSGNVIIGVAQNTADSGYSFSLAKAFEVAQSGDTIQLTNNISSTDTTTLAAGKNVTLDLNGKTLTANEEITIKGALTIEGTTADSKFNASGNGFNLNNNTGTLEIKGGVYNKSAITIGGESKDLSDYVASGTNCGLIVDSTTLYVGDSYTSADLSAYSAYTKVVIDGVDRYYATEADATTATSAAAYSLTQNGETKYYTTSEKLQAAREAITEGNVTIGAKDGIEGVAGYLYQAFNVAQSGDTVQLREDVSLTGGAKFDKDITLNLNGYELSTNGFNFEVAKGSTFAIDGTTDGSTFTATSSGDTPIQTIVLEAGANLNINGGTYTREDSFSKEEAFVWLEKAPDDGYTENDTTKIANEEYRGTINLTNIKAEGLTVPFVNSTSYDDYRYVTGYEINVTGGEYTSKAVSEENVDEHSNAVFTLPGMKANFNGVTMTLTSSGGGVCLPNRYDWINETLTNPESTPNAIFEDCTFTATGAIENGTSHPYKTVMISVAYANVAQIKSGTYTLGTKGNTEAKDGYGFYIGESGGGFIIDGGNFINNTATRAMITQKYDSTSGSDSFNDGKPLTTITGGSFHTTNSSNANGVVASESSGLDTKETTTITGGTYTKVDENGDTVGDESASAYVDETLQIKADGQIGNAGAGWTQDGSSTTWHYLIKTSDSDSATLLTATGVTDSNTVESGMYLGVSPYTANITFASGIPDTQRALYHVATYTKDGTAITIAPVTTGFSVADANFIGSGITKLTASGSVGINVDASGENLVLANITGGNGDDTLKAGARATTLDGGKGDDLLKGNTAADTFIFSGGNDIIQDYGEGDKFSLATGFSPITDGAKISGDINGFVLSFNASNSLTFTGTTPATLQSGDDTYVYTKDSVTKGAGVTLAAGHENSFEAPEAIQTIDASAVTNPINVKGNDEANYIIGSESGGTLSGGAGNDSLKAGAADTTLNGGDGNDSLIGGDGADVFIQSAGSDTIEGYDITKDVVTVTSALTTDPDNGINFDGSNFVISLGAADSLTFNNTTAIKLSKGNDTYYYAQDRVMLNGTSITLGSLFNNGTFNVSKLGEDYANVATIDASAVSLSSGLNITGNSTSPNSIIGAASGGTVTGGEGADTLQATGGSTTLNGGAGNDSLKGSDGSDTFAYTGGADRINSYGEGDLVSVKSQFKLSEATVSASQGETTNINLNFGDEDNLTFEEVNGVVSVQSGNNSKNYYLYAKDYIAYDKSITLTSNYTSGTFDGTNYSNYATINAATVGSAISIVGNENNNYIIGSYKGGSLSGGAGNDKLDVLDRGENAKYLFQYTAGKDEVNGFDAESDLLQINTSKITEARASNGKLKFTFDKNNSIDLKSEDEIEKVNLQGGGYLTKDGYVNGTSFNLFSNARGIIELNAELYNGITSLNAESVKDQSITLVGGTQGGAFYYAAGNKQRDGFEYGGGNVEIVGYEGGRDRIDLGAASLTSFAVNGNNVVLTVDGDKTISIKDAAGEEVLLHDANKGRTYQKMVFVKTGVIENKKKNPTAATVSTSYSTDSSVKKIFVEGNAEAVSIQAGDKNNTIIDASKAGAAVSLSGGKKNDKLTGSTYNDVFIYGEGKDIINGYKTGDSISLADDLEANIDSAKITASSKSIKFKFSNKNVLTVKGADSLGALNINGTERIYVKNAIADSSGKNVSLTSAFSGTFKTSGTKGLDEAVTYVDGAKVTKNLTFKGTDAAETLIGGGKKNMFKGGGGADSLVGGDGKDTFFYAKSDKGDATIANFEYGKDKLKVASGKISSISADGGEVTFSMADGSFKVEDNRGDTRGIAIKANNTFYWFADGTETLDSGEAVAAGALITADKRITVGEVSGFAVIDLNYSTNLAKTNVAFKVTGATPKKT